MKARRAMAVFVSLFSYLFSQGLSAETEDHERLAVRKVDPLSVSADLDFELSPAGEGILEGAAVFGLCLDLGSWFELGLSLPVLARLDSRSSCRYRPALMARLGRLGLRCGLGLYKGAWRFSADARLGLSPATEDSEPATILGLGCGLLRFLDPLALGLDLSAETGLPYDEQGVMVHRPLSLSLALVALEALNRDVSLILSLAQYLAAPAVFEDWKDDTGWSYSVDISIRLVISNEDWGLRCGFSGFDNPRFQAGGSLVWHAGDEENDGH